jgi:predicted nucleotidyltransferase
MAESSVDMEKVREFVKQKKKCRQERLNSRYEQACEDFEKMVSLIIRKYNPKRIYQWGSLLNREGFSEISDIDIAVEGIENYEEFSRMYGEI